MNLLNFKVESTIDRFLTRNPSLHVSNTHSLVEAHRNANIQELNVQLTRLLEMLEVQKRKGEALEEIREAGRRQCWWQARTDVLGLNELKQLRIALEELNRNVKKQANKVLVESTNCWQFLTANGIGGGVNNEANEMKAASSVTQVYNLGQGLF
ncbi:hypothetical protein SCA6_010906 [Theobroma cacao]